MSTTVALSDSTNKRKAEEDPATSKPSPEKKPTTETPFDAYMNKRDQYIKDNGVHGILLIRGISLGNSDDDEEEDTSLYTEEQMNHIRLVFITKDRAQALDDMRQLILGDQANDSFMMFNTSFSYDVKDSIFSLKDLIRRKRKFTDKFDLLFAYTHTIDRFDCWMDDNEGDMGDYVKELAAIWKRLLKKTDQELGIDTEYTRPGLDEFLRAFQAKVENMNSGWGGPKVSFKYQ